MNTSKPMTTLMAAILLTMAGLGMAHAGNLAPEPNPDLTEAGFKRMDDNRDGRLSLAEATRHGISAKAFGEGDDNHDGVLDRDEFIKASAVEDRIKVAQYVDDSVITARVKAELLKNSLVKGYRVRVETLDGTVQLSGFVKTEAQADTAAQIAAGVEGVKRIVNSLVVQI